MFDRDQIKSVLYGAVAADALSGPYTRLSREGLAERVIRMAGGMSAISFHRPGQWCDSSELTLCLAETVAKGTPLDLAALANRYIAWADSGPSDISQATEHALRGSTGLEEAMAKAAKFHRLAPRRFGRDNGAIRRVSPLAFLPLEGGEFRETVAAEVAITHGSTEAAEASFLQATFIRQLLLNGEIDYFARSLPRGFTDNILMAFEASENEEALQPMVSLEDTARCTLAVAMASLKYATYEEGVRWVVSLGHDSPANATCAGALLAARDGFESIPKEWLDPLEDKGRIDRAIEGLAAVNSA